MPSQNYSTTFLVDQTPDETFAAITDVRGWSPRFECFDQCSNAWGFYIDSLRNLITTGPLGAPAAARRRR